MALMGISEFDDVQAHLLEPEESLDSEQTGVDLDEGIHHRNARVNCRRGGSLHAKRAPMKVWRAGWPMRCPT
jgi:hypothetical protein